MSLVDLSLWGRKNSRSACPKSSPIQKPCVSQPVKGMELVSLNAPILSSSMCAWILRAKVCTGSLNPGSDADLVLHPCSDGGGDTGRFCDSELGSGVPSMRSGLPCRFVRELIVCRGGDSAEGIDGETPILY